MDGLFVRFRMKRRVTIALSAVACAILALIWFIAHPEITKSQRKITPPSFNSGQETEADHSEDFIERLKHELAEVESRVPPIEREKRQYFADSVVPNLLEGTIDLKGRVWHRDGVSLIDGRADPRSSMTIDAATLKIIEQSGDYELIELTDPN